MFADLFKRDQPFVLKGVTFDIPASSSLGIVGRTGSGKSSLLIALFRIVEVSAGSIRIDGVDISTISLQRLRRALSIVPQEPVLFSGSLRDNIDP